MTEHFMNLKDGPFLAMKKGLKKIEMRLYDDKRALLKVGDRIVFTNLTSKEILKVEIASLSRFKDFEELYAHFDKTDLGYEQNEVCSSEDMTVFYPKDEILKYGTLAIGVSVISE